MTEEKNRFSFEGKLTLIVAGLVVAATVLGVSIQFFVDSLPLSILLTAAIALPLSLWVMKP